jgi:serine/threonine-protein kinase
MRESATEDLLQEARLAGSIEHPNVVRVLEVSNEPASTYLVMEYVDGETLSSLTRHPLSTAQLATGVAVRVLLDALEGLQAAHELRGEHGEWLGLVHRDFTPQNVLVGKDGRAKLSDFGTAKAANAVQRTRTGQVKGKVAYMAPEQVRGLVLDRRCDVWAAGVMAWEILAGRPMHPDPDEVQTMFKVVSETPPLLRQVRPELPEGVEHVVERALRLDPEERWASATELHDALLKAWTQSHGPLPTTEQVAEAVAFARSQRPAPPPSVDDFPQIPAPPAKSNLGSWRSILAVAVAASALAGALGLWFGEAQRVRSAPLPRVSSPSGDVAPPTSIVATPRPLPSVPQETVQAPPLAHPAHRSSVRPRDARPLLQIVANEPVARVQVDQHWVPVDAPARQLQIPLAPIQAEQGFTLHVVSDRGQTLDTHVAPGAHLTRLEFVAKSSELRTRPSLADNPYGEPP